MDNGKMELLAQMAEKLGTTTEYLWTVLLKQATIVAYGNLACFFLALCIIWAAYKFVLRKTTESHATDEDGDSVIGAEWSGENAAWAWAVFFLLFLCTVGLVVPPLFSEAFTAFLNPEYWALQKIATLVK
jgi:hypothetical protein